MPVRKPTIPERMSRFVFESVRCIHPDNTDPIQAPELRAGANIPPAAPVLKEKMEPVMRIRGAYQGRYLFEVNKTSVMMILPEPISSVREIKPSRATTSPHTKTKATCWFVFLRRFLKFIKASRMRPVILPAKPVIRETSRTPRKI